MTEFFDGLSKEEQNVLKERIERFNELRKEPRNAIVPEENMILPKGTLIHGTSFNKETLKSISHSGIITGQFFGIEEDGETFYCADFHRVPEDQTLKEYNDKFPYNDGRCPFGNLGKNSVAFIIFPDGRMNEITKYDCFNSDTEEGKVARKFVNEEGLPYDDKEIMSSILFGVPSNFINGIVVGDNVISKENIDELIDLYPDVFIVRNNGQIIYKPGDNKEMTDLRVKNAEKDIKIEKLEKTNKALNDQVQNQKENESNMWDAIYHLPKDQIVKVLGSLGWQGDLEKYAEKLHKGEGTLK